MSTVLRVLVVEDNAGIRGNLTRALRREGCDVSAAGNRTELEAHLGGGPFDLLITDMRMQDDFSGLDALRLVQEHSPKARMFVLTAYPSSETTIQAIQRGAVDYITKEGDYLARIRAIVREDLARDRGEGEAPPLEIRSEERTELLIGESPAMLEIFKIVGRVAGRKSTVLITGESGTGKELIARAIHFHSPRRDRPLVSINCGALTETLLETELFGHVKGSFTGAVVDKKGLFEAADGGTLFLDEIGETSKAVQVKLLRVLQEERIRRVGDARDIKVDVRIIAATNQDPQELVREGTFREDLYFRLNVIPLHVPPLRERREDIPKLVRYFRDRYASAAPVEILPEAMDALVAYRWPGNVRELENIIERVLAMSTGEPVDPESLPPSMRSEGSSLAQAAEVPDITEGGIKLEEAVDEYERRLILKALESTGGRRPEAARLLGLTLRSFRYRLDKHEI